MRASKLFQRKLKNNHQVNDLKIDSRHVCNNDVFFAIKGKTFDGNDFIVSAIARGAKTVVSAKEWEMSELFSDINFMVVDDVEKTLAEVARIFYYNLSAQLTLIGITGTNGKTTVTTLLFKYFQYLNKKASLIGTNGIYIMNNFYTSPNTTPNILDIYRVLKESKKIGVSIVIMEVSSHAVKMMRVYGLEFKIVLLTNLTQDHLDYHKTMEDYKYTKAVFLASADANSTVIINRDIGDYQLFYRMAKGRVITFGNHNADYRYENAKYTIMGTEFTFVGPTGRYSIKTCLLGMFNIYNILAFLSIVDVLGLYSVKTIEFLGQRINILGRMEVVKIDDKYFIIDFAHTPDGVENVLAFLNLVKVNDLYVVIGCGGERDRSKRKVIGSTATTMADFVIFTNDNPRSEAAEQIISDILTGVKSDNYLIILDRSTAIREANRRALKNDIIAILGKGNEQYQIVNGNKIPYNDKKTVQGLKV